MLKLLFVIDMNQEQSIARGKGAGKLRDYYRRKKNEKKNCNQSDAIRKAKDDPKGNHIQ